MTSKIDNLLSISFQATNDELSQSDALSAGYDEITEKWEVIVKNNRPISFLEEMYEGISVYELLGGYSIINAGKEQLLEIAQLSEIDYMELPRNFYYNLKASKAASCIYNQSSQGILSNDKNTGTINKYADITGRGVIVAIIDSGIDILNTEFINKDNTSRIIAIYNQQNNRQYDRDDINEAVRQKKQLSPDSTGHGTGVAHIAAGNDGVAPGADIIAVKLAYTPYKGRINDTAHVQTASIMKAVDYVAQKALGMNRPVAINLSIGTNSGSHDGSSLLETYLDYIASIGRNVICVGAGNEAASGIHSCGLLSEGDNRVIELAVGEYESSFGIQLWKNCADEFKVWLITPSGRKVGPYSNLDKLYRYGDESTEVITFAGDSTPHSVMQEIYFELLPADNTNDKINVALDEKYVENGIWQIILEPRRIVNGAYDIWLPSSSVINNNSGFLENSPEMTVTIPATAGRVISVGAYDAHTMSYAAFSGRGAKSGSKINYYNVINKPDILAPGVDIVLSSGKINERRVSGTSFAAPFATGAAAVLMEWGITNGNDLYMYGQKVKAQLIKNAKPLGRLEKYPTNTEGWGILCLKIAVEK